MAINTRMSARAFLAEPEVKPYRELIDGEVISKSMPNQRHGRMVARLLLRLGSYLEATGEGIANTEVRHVDWPEDWVFLPDISVTIGSRVPPIDQNPVEVMPDLVIEVLSPDDRPRRVSQRVDFLLRNGARLLWVVDPLAETVTVYRPDEHVAVLGANDVLDARPVLAEFTLPLADLFAVLHAPANS